MTLSLLLCFNDLYLSEVAIKVFNSLQMRLENLSQMVETLAFNTCYKFNTIIGKVSSIVATYKKKIYTVSELFNGLYKLHMNSFEIINDANNTLKYGTQTPTHQTLLKQLLSECVKSWKTLSFWDQGVYTSIYQAFEKIIRDTEKVVEYINENKMAEMSTLQDLFKNITKDGYYQGKSAGDAVVQFTKELLMIAKDKSVGALKRACEALQEWKKSPEYLRETPGEKPCAFITDAEAAAAAKVAAKVPSLASNGSVVSGVVSALPSSKGSSQARSATTPVVRPSSKSPVKADRSVPRSSSGTASRVGTPSPTRNGGASTLSSSRSVAGSVPKSRTTAAGSSPQRLPPRAPVTQGAVKSDCTEKDSATARKMVAKRAVVPSANNQSPIASLGRSSVRIVPGKDVKNEGVKGVINKGALGSEKPLGMCSSHSGGLKTNKAPGVVRGRSNSPAVGVVSGRLASKSPAPTLRTATAATTSAKPSANPSGRAAHKVASGNATSHLSSVVNKARSDSPNSSNKVNSGARTNEQSPILRKVLKSDQQPKTSATVEKTKVLKSTATVRPASPVRAGSKSGTTTSVAVGNKATKAADKTAASTVATPPRTLRSAAGSPSTTRVGTSSGAGAAGTGGAKSSKSPLSVSTAAKQSAKQAGEKKDAAVAGLGGCGAAAGKTGKKGNK